MIHFAECTDDFRSKLPPVLYRRFSEKEHALSFIDDGAVRFMNLLYYKALEDGDTRKDFWEGEFKQGLDTKGLQLYIKAPDNNFTLDNLVSVEMAQTLPDMDAHFISCYSMQLHEEQHKNYGKYVVEITNPTEFINRFSNAKISPYIAWQDVVYYEHENVSSAPTDRLINSPLWARKRIGYKNDHEFRIALLISNLKHAKSAILADKNVQSMQHKLDNGNIMKEVMLISNMGSLNDIATLTY